MSESRFYITLLLLTRGFWALPLMWHSSSFTKRSKIAWSVAVPLLALLYFGLLIYYGRTIYVLIKPWLRGM